MNTRKLIATVMAGLATLGATMGPVRAAPLSIQRFPQEIKMESTGKIEGTDLGYYSFVSLYPNDYYGEASISKPVKGRLSGMLETNFGSGYDDCLRAGLNYVPKTPEGTFLQLKYLPFATADKGEQVGLVFCAKRGRTYTANWYDYNIKPGSVVGESLVGYDLTDKISAVAKVPHDNAAGFGEPVFGIELRLK